MNNEFKKIQLSSETRYILESAGVGGTSTGGGATLGTALGGMKRRIPTRENDHEIEMASKELSSIIRNSRELLDILKDYSEQTGLEAWQQSKITKATDYLNSVLQSIDRVQQAPAMKDNNQNDENVSEGKLDELHDDLKTLSNEEFEKEYGMTKTEARVKFSGKDKPNWVHEGSEKKGLYYYVNKRKKAGTSRPAGHPKAPTAQAWKDAAKTAKKEGVAEGPKDTKPGWMLRQMRDKNDPAFQKIANKQAAMAALKQPSKNNQQGVAGDSRYDDEYGPTAREKWLQQQAYEKAYNKK